LASQSNGHELRIAESAHGVNQVVLLDGHRNDVRSESGAFPDQLAIVRIVGAHFFGRADHNLLLSFEVCDQWRGPGARLVAARAAHLPARSFVSRDNERAGITIAV